MENRNSPLVSVIIPTYNRADVVINAIDSVLKQDFKDFEIIVVDDGSEDNTLHVLSNYPSIKLIASKHIGMPSARNAGLAVATGKYIVSLDSDDTWEKQYLSKSLKYIEQFDLDIFCSNWMYHKGGNFLPVHGIKSDVNTKYNHSEFYLFDYTEFRQLILKSTIVPTSGIILKRDILGKGWETKVNIADDAFLLTEIVVNNKACKIGLTNKILWNKYRSKNSVCDGVLSADMRGKHILDLKLLRFKLKNELTVDEKQLILKNEIQNYLMISRIHLFEKNFKESFNSLKVALSYSPMLILDSLVEGGNKVIKRKYIEMVKINKWKKIQDFTLTFIAKRLFRSFAENRRFSQ